MHEKPNPFLRSLPPFDLIPLGAMREVARFSFERDFRKGETIFVEGAAAQTVWLVRQGRVHLEKLHSNGRSSTVCVKAKGGFLCCLPALDRNGYPAAAIAREPSKLVGIPFEVFSTLMGKWPEFSQRVVAILCGCLREVGAMKEEQDEIKTLQAENADLKARLEKLERAIEERHYLTTASTEPIQ